MERRLHDFIPELKDYYTVTSDGEFYSDNSGKMKTRNRAGTEYQIINFSLISGGKRTFRAHRLVLMAFNPVENMDELEVNHIDGNKKNNKLENLEWCTTSENQLHAIRTGLSTIKRGEECPSHKLTEKDVLKVFELKEEGLTNREIAKIVNCTPSNISCILNGKSWKNLKAQRLSKDDE